MSPELREILIATGNRNKLVEILAALADLPIVFRDMSDFEGVKLPAERGLTLRENAIAKARAGHDLIGLCTIADDSGFEVDYLEGAPGVFSARYAGEDVGYEANNRLLLKRLVNVPRSQRMARFRCVMALVDDGAERTTEGVSLGRVLNKPRGTGGFGYDPLFLPDGEKRTFAEMGRKEKTRISHRGRALTEMRKVLSELYNL